MHLNLKKCGVALLLLILALEILDRCFPLPSVSG